MNGNNSYKAEVRVIGETSFHANGLRFPDPEQAEAYAKNLWARWMQMEEYRIVGSDDAPTHTADEYGYTAEIKPEGGSDE